MDRWYVVRSLPNQERRAAEHLARQGFRPWLPQIRRTRRHARRLETVRRPLFPGYLFVALDLALQNWLPVLSTRGVRALVSGPDGPVPLPEAVARALRARLDADDVLIDTQRPFRPGQKVRVTAGPFAEIEGIFLAETGAQRVEILLRLLGRETRVTVAAADLESE
jgi:transcriptional antiterminator RfaH